VAADHNQLHNERVMLGHAGRSPGIYDPHPRGRGRQKPERVVRP